MAKRKYQGKTKAQWDNLYNKYKAELKGKRGITRLNKTEFKQAWLNRNKGTSVKDIAKATLNEDKYNQYTRSYEKFEKRGFSMGSMLSKRAFEQEFGNYKNISEMVESQFFVSRKQADNWLKHAQKLGLDNMSLMDFFKENDKSDKFWDTIAALGGWEAAFEY